MDAVVKSPENSSRPIEKVTIHPLVLLSTVDHYIRLSQCPLRRVVGVLLGSSFEGTVNVSNSYPVPFDEDDMDPSAWFLDLNYVEKMFSMFKKIYDKEQIVGWYSTGPELQENDMDIHSLFHKYVPNPVLVIVDVLSTELGIPTKACYCDVEEVKEKLKACQEMWKIHSKLRFGTWNYRKLKRKRQLHLSMEFLEKSELKLHLRHFWYIRNSFVVNNECIRKIKICGQ